MAFLEDMVGVALVPVEDRKGETDHSNLWGEEQEYSLADLRTSLKSMTPQGRHSSKFLLRLFLPN